MISILCGIHFFPTNLVDGVIKQSFELTSIIYLAHVLVTLQQKEAKKKEVERLVNHDVNLS